MQTTTGSAQPAEISHSMTDRERWNREARRGVLAVVALPLLLAAAAVLAASYGAEDADPAVDSAPETVLGGSSPAPASPACPVTIPPQPALVPPPPWTRKPPPLYDAVWYGTPELWTMLDAAGEIWGALPGLGQKTFWWSQDFDVSVEPQPDITVTGERLDHPGQSLSVGPGTNGRRGDIGSFMLVGIEFPAPGCWELTARYGDAELSYVVWLTG